MYLTPKGPNVRTVDKPILVSVTWAHTIFRFLETFCKMHLVVSFVGVNKKIVFFGPMDQKLWVFKVFRRSLGPMRKTWPITKKLEAGERRKGGRGCNNGGPTGSWLAAASRLWLGDHWSVSGCPEGNRSPWWATTNNRPPATSHCLCS
jgi:hypothetical protein